MSEVATLIADMVRSGVDPDIIGRTAEALAQREPVKIIDEQAERRRAADRERKAALRNSAESADKKKTKENTPHTPLKKTTSLKENPPKGGQKKRGFRLPEDWQPTDKDWQMAVDRWGEDGAREELAAFRDHWRSKPGQAALKLDWDATWRNWIRNSRRQPKARGSPSTTPAGFR